MERMVEKSSKGRSQLSNDLMESIFRRLPIADLVRIKLLCSFWNSFAKHFLAKHFKYRTPFLILPPQQEGEEKDVFTKYSSSYDVVDRYRLVNLQENMAYPLKKTTSDILAQHICIGSSHGWLIFSDFKTLTPELFNPFTDQKIRLPSFKSSLGITAIEETKNPNEYRYLKETEYSDWEEINVKHVFLSFVLKAILTATAATATDYGVVLKCRYLVDSPMLLYYKKGDDSWTNFFTWDVAQAFDLSDIICYQDRIYALRSSGLGLDNWIQSWNVGNGYPENMILIKTAGIAKNLRCRFEGGEGIGFCGFDKSYLVEFNGEFLLVVRYIGTCDEEEEEGGDVDRGYKTRGFTDIFKLDAKNKEWKQVKNLGLHNVALFVGINHSMAISSDDEDFKGNCVYFTHHPEFPNDWSGRDMGVWSLNCENKSERIKPFFGFSGQVQFSPMPCWLFPSY